jgi:hypothetical protein
VLDDEPILVVDHVTGRGFRLTMSGVGDNFQRHTLIDDPGRRPGTRARRRRIPGASLVAAATTAPPQPPADDPIQRRFRLFDGTGAYICPEGRPADIPPVDGVRVIVLYPPRGQLQLGRSRRSPRTSRRAGFLRQLARLPVGRDHATGRATGSAAG